MDSSTFRRSWTPIGETSNQLIVYHPPSHAIQVVPRPGPRQAASHRPHATQHLYSSYPSAHDLGVSELTAAPCPFCGRLWPLADLLPEVDQPTSEDVGQDTHYFRILERAHERSRPGTPVRDETRDSPRESYSTPSQQNNDDIDETDLPAMGYYQRFFKEEGRLGIGAEGSVFLATHIISGNELGTYAVKKIAVGCSRSYLVKMLREVRLLEALRHPNIIPYYHSWVDETRFSSFGPPIIALHILMMFASAGNLDAFLLSRSHHTSQAPFGETSVMDNEANDILSKKERIEAFKRKRGMGINRGESRGVLLLGFKEILKLFGDVVEGLSFLHANSVLHLDLKCSNVLLHWEEGQVIPKALLSDFGTSEEMFRGQRNRTGHTGTMEYMAPETIVLDGNGNWRPSDSHADIWSLGMVLHKMLFLRLPYHHADDFSALHSEILRYPGFLPSSDMIHICERRHIPGDLLLMLAKLLHISPDLRPTAGKVRTALQQIAERKVTANAPSATGDQSIQLRSIGGEAGQYRTVESPLPNIQALPFSQRMMNSEGLVPLSFWPRRRRIQHLVFIAKILSLQQAILSTQLPFVAVLLLIGLAIIDFEQENSFHLSLSLTIFHICIVMGGFFRRG